MSCNNRLFLTSPIPVSVNHYLAYKVMKSKGRSIAMSYPTKETKAYMNNFVKYVKDEMEKQNFIPSKDKNQFIHYDVTVYFPRIDMDSNNYYKLPLDALKEANVIIDDNIILERCKRIYYDANNPRLEIEIYYSDYIGIFDNHNDLDVFLNQCKECSKYRDGACSCLQKAKIGKIQNEIQDFVCLKFKKKK